MKLQPDDIISANLSFAKMFDLKIFIVLIGNYHLRYHSFDRELSFKIIDKCGSFGPINIYIPFTDGFVSVSKLCELLLYLLAYT